MNNSADSYIVLNCKTKRKEVQKIKVLQSTNNSTGTFLEPYVSCLFFDSHPVTGVEIRYTVPCVRVF